jgi:hypothetical protein
MGIQMEPEKIRTTQNRQLTYDPHAVGHSAHKLRKWHNPLVFCLSQHYDRRGKIVCGSALNSWGYILFIDFRIRSIL